MTTAFKNRLSTSLPGTQTTLTVTTVTASSPSTGFVTLGFATQTSTPYAVGSYIYVSGVSVFNYNGGYLVVNSGTNFVTISNSTTGSATGGTIVNTILTSNPSAVTTVIGLSLTNTSSELTTATIQIQDTIVGSTAYYISNVVVPAYQSLRVVSNGEKLVLGNSNNVFITSSIPNTLDLVMSYVEIS
jgi:hypothetical protein